MIKLPAEWEKQKFIQLVFPHKNSDWKYYLKDAELTFINIAENIAKYQKCLVICNDKKYTKQLFNNVNNIKFIQIKSNDTWSRDFGGITIFNNTKKEILDFGFNGWGLKFASNLDNKITQKMLKKNIIKNVKKMDIILEGGSIDSNGNGTLLTTSECLLENNRNSYLSKKQIDKKLKKYFGLKNIIWLNNGFLKGDDTDSHIDTLARFVDKNSIVYNKCYDKNDIHFKKLNKMEKELKKTNFNLIPIPLPKAIYFENERLPATYANFLIINNAVLIPTYNNKYDKKALKIFQKIFQNRDIIAIDCSTLIKQHGSLHCVTMQYY